MRIYLFLTLFLFSSVTAGGIFPVEANDLIKRAKYIVLCKVISGKIIEQQEPKPVLIDGEYITIPLLGSPDGEYELKVLRNFGKYSPPKELKTSVSFTGTGLDSVFPASGKSYLFFINEESSGQLTVSSEMIGQIEHLHVRNGGDILKAIKIHHRFISEVEFFTYSEEAGYTLTTSSENRDMWHSGVNGLSSGYELESYIKYVEKILND